MEWTCLVEAPQAGETTKSYIEKDIEEMDMFGGSARPVAEGTIYLSVKTDVSLHKILGLFFHVTLFMRET